MGVVSGEAPEFDLPWPPSVNRYYRHVGSRVLVSHAGRLYRSMVVSRLGGRYPREAVALRLTAEFYPPDRRKRDLDNLLKCLQDSLQAAGLFFDDCQIRSLRLDMKEPTPPEGFVHVKLEALPAGVC